MQSVLHAEGQQCHILSTADRRHHVPYSEVNPAGRRGACLQLSVRSAEEVCALFLGSRSALGGLSPK